MTGSKPAKWPGPVRDVQPWTAPEVARLLEGEYGRPAWRARRDPMSELVYTVLSQHTSDVNSLRAFTRLRERFPTWQELAEGDPPDIARAIQPGGLERIKAPRLKALASAVREQLPDFDLSFLLALELDEAKLWLRSLPGVGPKTAACVLMFALGRPALPVDTHVYRVARRLALIPVKVSEEQAHEALAAQVPPEDIYSFHVGMVRHGRETCRAAKPLCHLCVLAPRCPSAFTFVPALAHTVRG